MNKVHAETLNGTVNIYRENWKNHVQCMTENVIRRKMMDYQLQGIRSRGRSRKSWQEQTSGTAADLGA
jgi:hypothetical protein